MTRTTAPTGRATNGFATTLLLIRDVERWLPLSSFPFSPPLFFSFSCSASRESTPPLLRSSFLPFLRLAFLLLFSVCMCYSCWPTGPFGLPTSSRPRHVWSADGTWCRHVAMPPPHQKPPSFFYIHPSVTRHHFTLASTTLCIIYICNKSTIISRLGVLLSALVTVVTNVSDPHPFLSFRLRCFCAPAPLTRPALARLSTKKDNMW